MIDSVTHLTLLQVMKDNRSYHTPEPKYQVDLINQYISQKSNLFQDMLLLNQLGYSINITDDLFNDLISVCPAKLGIEELSIDEITTLATVLPQFDHCLIDYYPYHFHLLSKEMKINALKSYISTQGWNSSIIFMIFETGLSDDAYEIISMGDYDRSGEWQFWNHSDQFEIYPKIIQTFNDKPIKEDIGFLIYMLIRDLSESQYIDVSIYFPMFIPNWKYTEMCKCGWENPLQSFITDWNLNPTQIKTLIALYPNKPKTTQIIDIIYKHYGKECPICLEDITNSVIVLPCGDYFHDTCVQDWFQSKTICPICIRPI